MIVLRAALACFAVAAAACTEERLAIELPPEVKSAESAIVAIADQNSLRSIVAIEPSDAASLHALPALPDYDGEELAIAALAYERPLSDFGLSAGALAASTDAAARRLADVETDRRSSFALTIAGETQSAWAPVAALPPPVADYRVPPFARDRCGQIQFRSVLPADPQPLLNVITIALPSNDRAVFGGTRTPTVAILGTADRSGEIRWRELGAETERVRALAWDGQDTVFGWVKLVFLEESRLIQLDISGETRLEYPLPITEDETFQIAAGAGRIIAYSELRAIELVAGSTRTIDRTADFPLGLMGLIIVAADRMAAVTNDGWLHYFDGNRWQAEDRPTAPEAISKLFGNDSVLVALSYGDVFLRDENRREWPRLETPFATLPKLAAIGLPGGDFMLAGGIGVLAIYEQGARSWCRVNTGTIRYLQQLYFSPDRRVGVSSDHDDPEIQENSIFHWIDLPEGGP